jgi:hypothetical protein
MDASDYLHVPTDRTLRKVPWNAEYTKQDRTYSHCSHNGTLQTNITDYETNASAELTMFEIGSLTPM